MASEFSMVHRVEFAETDLAGIMHFSNFFRWMEVTEHAFLRSLGLSVHAETEGRLVSFPRVHAECDYKRPLRYGDEVSVLLTVREKRAKTLTYDFSFRAEAGRGGEAARGSITVVAVTRDETGRMQAIPIPEPFDSRIEPAEGAEE